MGTARNRSGENQNSTIMDLVYAYSKDNLIAVALFLINFAGLVLFMLYFMHIDYLPNLDFSGTMYLLVAMAFVGMFFFILLATSFVLPGLTWRLFIDDLHLADGKQKFQLSGLSTRYVWVFGTLYIAINFVAYFIAVYLQDIQLYLGKFDILIYLSAFIVVLLLASVIAFSANQWKKGIAWGWTLFITALVSTLPLYFILLLLNTNPQVSNGIGLFIALMAMLATNSLVILVEKFIYSLLIGMIFFSYSLLSIGQSHFIPTLVANTLHFGAFDASKIVFKKDYCQILGNYHVLPAYENNVSCYLTEVKVYWRIGKESLLEIGENNVTVPSDQIISMSWEGRKPPKVLFEYDSNKTTVEGEKALVQIIRELKEKKPKEITVYGYASIEGSDRHNMGLSEARAEVIKKRIEHEFSDANISVKILSSKGKGADRLKADEKFMKKMKDSRVVEIIYSK